MMRKWSTASIFLVIVACALAYGLFVLFGDRAVDERSSRLIAASYSSIPGWEDDNHAKAFAAFRRSCERIVSGGGARAGKKKNDTPPRPLKEICKTALALGEETGSNTARDFFEAHFTPHRYAGEELSGFVTGYFEPELRGSRNRSDRYSVPVYGVPDDLVQLYPDAERAARNHEMSAGRKTSEGLKAYYDRKEIEQGALQGQGLEILYLEDWSDAFYMHIQGSGRVALEQGGHVRLGFAAKNGHSYTAIGKVLIERGAISAKQMSMDAVRGWLDANPKQARALMWENRSYIFFRELPGGQAASGPVGAQGVILSARRSLAVDTSVHELGTPVWVSAPALDVHGKAGFSQLMIAQDAGSAIKGPQRGDIFFGSGKQAGENAGATRHKAQFTVLLPKIDVPGN